MTARLEPVAFTGKALPAAASELRSGDLELTGYAVRWDDFDADGENFLKGSVRVRVESVTVDDVEGSQPRAVIGEATDYTDADVLLANVGTPPGERPESKLDAAKALILRMIEDAGGELDAGLVYVAGESAEITERTLRRARADLGVIVEGKRWTLPSALAL